MGAGSSCHFSLWRTFVAATNFKGLFFALGLLGCSSPDDVCSEYKPPFDKGALLARCDAERVTCAFRASTTLAAMLPDGTIMLSTPMCEADPVLCAFALWHEIGHVRGEASENAADCYAGSHASPEEVQRAICFFSSTFEVHPSGTHPDNQARARVIEACYKAGPLATLRKVLP